MFLALGGVGYAAADSLRDLNREQNRPLWSGRSYSVKQPINTTSSQTLTTGAALCDAGDAQTGGGVIGLSPAFGTLVGSTPTKITQGDGPTVYGWSITFLNKQSNQQTPHLQVIVRCAEFGEQHSG